MSLDNIQLPPIVIQDLYKNLLVDLNNGKAISIAGKTEFAFLGSNKKRICVVVADENALYLGDDLLNFLLGILSACKLTMADVAVLNKVKQPGLNYEAINKELQAEVILLFGVQPDQLELPLQFPNYQIQKYNNQQYLCAPGLQLLQKEKEEKLKLWNCLKQLFTIS